MTTTAEKSETKLTDYEQAQVEKIASWKASHPNAFGELFHRVTRPVARFFELIVPDAVALGASTRSTRRRNWQPPGKTSSYRRGLRICRSCGRSRCRCATIFPQVWHDRAGRRNARRCAHGGWWSLDHFARRAFTIRRVPHNDHQDRALLRLRARSAHRQSMGPGGPDASLSDSKERRTDLMVQLRTIEELCWRISRKTSSSRRLHRC